MFDVHVSAAAGSDTAAAAGRAVRKNLFGADSKKPAKLERRKSCMPAISSKQASKPPQRAVTPKGRQTLKRLAY